MPWYWTDELARTLIESGRVDRARVKGWIVSPVAVRRDEALPADVAGQLLDEEDELPPAPAALAA